MANEVKGKKALEMLGAMIDPIMRIVESGEIKLMLDKNEQVIRVVQRLLKKWPGEVLEILAYKNGKDPEEFADEVDMSTVQPMLIELFQDTNFITLFFSLAKTE